MFRANYRVLGICVFFVTVFAVTACTPKSMLYKSSPSTQVLQSSDYRITLSSICNNGRSYGCSGFVLTISNKMKKNIEIDWNKTLYVNNSITSGGFMFEGVVYKERNNQKPNDVVFPNSVFVKTIYPNNLVDFIAGTYISPQWIHRDMISGEQGIYLVMKIDEKEVKEKITVTLSLIN